MTQTTPKTTRSKFTLADIEGIASDLRKLPKLEKRQQSVSKQEAVKLLVKEIHLLQDRGYSLDSISSLLSERGLNIAAGTMKSYLQRAKSAKKERETRTSKSGTSPMAALSPTTTQMPPTPKTPIQTPSSESGTFVPRRDTKDI